jgi:hypothetical protein
MKAKTRTIDVGSARITLSYPPSTLSEHEAKITEVIGRRLPDDVRALYKEHDGIRYACGHEENTLVGLADMFGGVVSGGFRRHTPVKTMDAEEIASPDEPFYEALFSEEFSIESKKDLARLNALKRQKMLVSVAGESAYLTIDFFDPKQDYALHLAKDACDLFRLDLRFPEFVEQFTRFGATRWYFAYLDKEAAEEMNVDLRAELEASLAPFREHGAFAREITELLARFDRS